MGSGDNKILAIRDEIGIRIAKKEDPDQTASSEASWSALFV